MSEMSKDSGEPKSRCRRKKVDEPSVPEVTEEVAAVEPEAATEADSGMEVHPGAGWYVVHTYSGYENKVSENMHKRIVSMAMQDQIFNVLVPTEEEIEFTKDGRKRTIQRKIYPGYVLVEMVMNDESWYVVRNTPGVTGFVSPSAKPDPLPLEEVRKIKQLMGLVAPVKVEIQLEVGQMVKIVHGGLQGHQGQVVEVDNVREKVRILVSMFGREAPADVDFSQVEKI